MWMVDDAGAVADLVEATADSAGHIVVPSEVTGSGWEAHWPAPDNPQAFVRLARDAGAKVLYLRRVLGREYEDVDDRHHDDVALMRAAWVVDGVVNRLDVASAWWQADALAGQLAADVERYNESIVVDRYARQVVDDPIFQVHSGNRDAARDAVVATAFPDMEPGRRYLVAARAANIDRVERVPAREAGWAARARELMAQGTTKTAIAEQLGITTSVLNRVLQQNPPT